LNNRFPSDTLLQRYWLPTIRGSIELARKGFAANFSASWRVENQARSFQVLAGEMLSQQPLKTYSGCARWFARKPYDRLEPWAT